MASMGVTGPGHSWTETYYVYECFHCHDFYDSYTKGGRDASDRQTREEGWSKATEGWICPVCALRKRQGKL